MTKCAAFRCEGLPPGEPRTADPPGSGIRPQTWSAPYYWTLSVAW